MGYKTAEKKSELEVFADYLSVQKLEKNFRGDPNDHMCLIKDQEFYYGYGWIVHNQYAGWCWYPEGEELRVPDGPLRDKLVKAFPGTEDKDLVKSGIMTDHQASIGLADLI